VAAGVISAGAGMYDANQQANAQKGAIAPLQQANSTAYSKAESIANTPYTPYTGTQVAPITGGQQQAITQAQTVANNGQAQSDVANSENLAGQIAGNGWSSSTAQKYMNPYTQNVTDVAQKQLNQQYANTINAQNATAASTGAFGGDRAALTNANTTGQYLYQSGNLAATNQANAYNSAIQTWQADNNRAQQAASSYQAAGNDITQMNSQQIKDLLATGGVVQATQQMQLNANYNNYLDQRNWSANELQPLLQATGNKGTPANPTPQNTASDLLGMGSALAGYFGSNSNNGAPTVGNSAPSADLTNSIGGASYSPTLGGGAGFDSIGGYCDYGLKKNVEPIYFDGMSHLPVYAFHYKTQADHEPKWRGYIAQEVQVHYPDAVARGPRGFLWVDARKVPAERTYPWREPSEADWRALESLQSTAE
jgi:hypothetical protein